MFKLWMLNSQRLGRHSIGERLFVVSAEQEWERLDSGSGELEDPQDGGGTSARGSVGVEVLHDALSEPLLPFGQRGIPSRLSGGL